jgi:hypothetical protein
MTLSLLLCFVLGVYYFSVIAETLSEKYYTSLIHTKKDFFLCLIPFFMWIKLVVKAIQELED